jgi:hypothetical protein
LDDRRALSNLLCHTQQLMRLFEPGHNAGPSSGSCGVEFGKPRHRRLVEHLGRVALLAHARPSAQKILHRNVEPLAIGQLVAQS